jgi:hypothetical protein
LEIDRLDNKAQSWAHSIDIFIHDPFDNGGFARIVKPAATSLAARTSKRGVDRPHSISTRISLSFNRAFLSIESIFRGHQFLDRGLGI